MNVGHADRAALYGVEIAQAAPPTLLDALLRPNTTVAEVPSGSGHFLRTYARHGADIHLLDAEPAMLDAARRQADLWTVPCRTEQFRLGADRREEAFDLVVCPNAAVNYLVPRLGLHDTLAALTSLVAPGGVLLAQVLLRHVDGTIDRGTCYDPRARHDSWISEWTRPDGAGGTLSRRRRQVRAGDDIEVEFERVHNGRDLGRSTVHLKLTTASSLVAAACGLTPVACRRGDGDLSELALRRGER